MLIPAVQRLRIGLALGASVIASAHSSLSARLEAKLIEHNLEALGGVLQHVLLHPRDLWLGALRQANLPSSRILAL